MDLRENPEQARFRAEARDWLRRCTPTSPLPPVTTAEGLSAHRDWERRLWEAGYSALHWPVEYGGGGADVLLQAIFQEEYVRVGAPERINRLGLGLIGPTIMTRGSWEQKSRWLPRILSGEDLWCQGFSEPEAGSDLAALTTRAHRDGDVFVVNGQKTWTSFGMVADWMFALVRSDPNTRKHRGITYLLIPMDCPGIEVRPLRQLHGDIGFAEVFFTDVRVPVENVLGDVGDGWRVAMETLRFERGSALGNHARYSQDVDTLVSLVRRLGLDRDADIRMAVADLYVQTQVFRRHMQHVITRQARGEDLGFQASLTKLFWSEMETRIFEMALDILGPLAELKQEAPAAEFPGRLDRRYWHARAAKIFAGTSEIQKNLIAERLVGLPRGA